MLKFAMILTTVTVLFAQDAGKPKQGDAPAQKPVAKRTKLPPFPIDKAKWAIRGKVKVSHLLKPAEDPRDQRMLCNPDDLRLQNVFVFVRGLEKDWSFDEAAKPSLTVHVADGQFRPLVTRCAPGGTVWVRSPDPLKEQFFWFTMQWEWQGKPGKGIKFRRPGTVGLIHQRGNWLRLRSKTYAWMRSTIHFLPHPIFSVTDKNGWFFLPKLPDGEYELVLIHELLGKVTKKVKIDGKTKKPVTFVFEVPDKLRAKSSKARKRK